MRKVLTLSLLLCNVCLCIAQRDANEFKGRKKPYTCEDLIVRNNELSGKSETELPTDFILSPITFGIIKTPETTVNVIRFYIPYYPYRDSENGVYFKLSNGEILRFPNAKVDVSYTRGGNYSLSCYMQLDAGTIDTLKENFITQFSVGDKTIDIEERNHKNLHTLFNCMFP